MWLFKIAPWFTGTILDNIIGSSTQLTRRDAWEIVEKVNLSTLIKSLPMQMDTLVTEAQLRFLEVRYNVDISTGFSIET